MVPLRLQGRIPAPYATHEVLIGSPEVKGDIVEKRNLSERDICTKFILPAVKSAGWDDMLQVREEVYFTKDRIIVRGKLVTRGKAKKADFVLYYKPNTPSR